jgi:hypothetical protein
MVQALQQDEGFQQALRTAHGNRPGLRTGAAGRLATGRLATGRVGTAARLATGMAGGGEVSLRGPPGAWGFLLPCPTGQAHRMAANAGP